MDSKTLIREAIIIFAVILAGVITIAVLGIGYVNDIGEAERNMQPAFTNTSVMLTVPTDDAKLAFITEPDGVIISAEEYTGILTKIGEYTFTDSKGNQVTVNVTNVSNESPVTE